MAERPGAPRPGEAAPTEHQPLALAPVLTITEAASLVRISRNSAYEAARRGEIPIIRLGRRLLVPRAALERMLERAGIAHEDGDGAHGR